MHTRRGWRLIFFHTNHAINIGNYESVVIASPDTDIFVSVLHHFCKLKYFDLEELQFDSGRGNSRTFFSIHDLANDLDLDLVEVLPAIHALTGCDTASKVGGSWFLPLTIRIWQWCIEWWNDCWCWEVSPKMYNKAWCWHFRWTAFYCLPWEIFGVWH